MTVKNSPSTIYINALSKPYSFLRSCGRGLVLMLLVSFATASVAATHKYKIRGDAEGGTKFRPVEVSSPIPFDKSYSEMSEEEQNIFRENYGVLAANEVPPFPSEGMGAIYRPIIKAHRDIARAGKLFLVAMIDESGKVENVSVYESPHPSMTKYASTVLFNTKFDAAVCGQSTCKMEFPFEMDLRKKTRGRANKIR